MKNSSNEQYIYSFEMNNSSNGSSSNEIASWIILKNGKVSFVLSPIHDIFENGNSNIVVKTVKRFNVKRTHIIIFN